MPLLDHFHPPLSECRRWASFLFSWACNLADFLNARLGTEYFVAEPLVRRKSGLKLSFDKPEPDLCIQENGPGTSTSNLPRWTLHTVFPDSFEVRIINTDGGPKLAAAIELVSPGNKDRPLARRAFAAKCANFLSQGIPFIVMDIVTNRSANLHNEIMDLMLTEDC